MQFSTLLLTAATAFFASAQEVPDLAAALNSTESLSSLNTLLGSYPECKCFRDAHGVDQL